MTLATVRVLKGFLGFEWGKQQGKSVGMMGAALGFKEHHKKEFLISLRAL